MIKLYRCNTGSCGGCDLELDAAVRAASDLGWADHPQQADLLILTGPLSVGSRTAFLQIWRELAGSVPLVAIGRCAIDGHPFGRGGLAEFPDIVTRLKLDGCPPDVTTLTEALRKAAAQGSDASR